MTFGYKNDRIILNSISFVIPKGKVTAIIGESGVGKTTIFSLLERFYDPLSGSIHYGSIPIQDFDLYEWRKKIAYVSQEVPIIQGTILNNLTYGLDLCPMDKVIKTIRNVGMIDFIESLPMRFNTEVGERGIMLSGGQRQRIAIARALIRNAEILLLDEATSHLDSNSECFIQSSLNRLMTGRTTLIIARRLSTVKNADQIIILEKGRISGVGQHEELYQTNKLYQTLVLQQLNKEGC